jgi:hypothetical protein
VVEFWNPTDQKLAIPIFWNKLKVIIQLHSVAAWRPGARGEPFAHLGQLHGVSSP